MRSSKKLLPPSSAARFAALLIGVYQKTLSPDHGLIYIWPGTHCRFFPSCSDYARQAVRQYGLLYGAVVSVKRILRCGPWHQGGYDPLTPTNK